VDFCRRLSAIRIPQSRRHRFLRHESARSREPYLWLAKITICLQIKKDGTDTRFALATYDTDLKVRPFPAVDDLSFSPLCQFRR
jgi:hypothetical protein